MIRIYVKPGEGRTVPIPGPGPRRDVPEKGAWVDEHDTYFGRCLMHGDLLPVAEKDIPPEPEDKPDNPPAKPAAAPVAPRSSFTSASE